MHKGAFTLANFARDFALSLHVLLNKNHLFSLLNVQASAKSRQCKRTFRYAFASGMGEIANLVQETNKI